MGQSENNVLHFILFTNILYQFMSGNLSFNCTIKPIVTEIKLKKEWIDPKWYVLPNWRTNFWRGMISLVWWCFVTYFFVNKHFSLFQLFSGRDLTDLLNKSKDILSDEKKDWEKRNEAVSIWNLELFVSCSSYRVLC
jgi:hypothetical protein